MKIAALAVLGAAACSGGGSTTAVNQKGLIIAFDLIPFDAAVLISVDGLQYGVIATNTPVTVEVPASSQTLTYLITNSPVGTTQDVQPDIVAAGGTLPISASSNYSITNVISGTTYFDAVLADNAGFVAYIGIYRSGVLTCLGPTPVTTPFTKDFGYWRLAADTEIRAYQTLGCSGAYHSWPYAQIAAASAPNTGQVTLTLTSIP